MLLPIALKVAVVLLPLMNVPVQLKVCAWVELMKMVRVTPSSPTPGAPLVGAMRVIASTPVKLTVTNPAYLEIASLVPETVKNAAG